MAADIDQESLGLRGADPATTDAVGLVDDGDPGPGRRVAVAIDAAGAAGAHPFTYRVPARLEPLLPGEAILVEFGRRQALGIVLGDSTDGDGFVAKPVVDRVRADGPLLPPTSIALAQAIAATYLAPPALVLRAMLPPGLLERLELVAERRPRQAALSVDGPGATKMALALDPDVVVMDVRLGRWTGSRPAGRSRSGCPRLPSLSSWPDQ